MKKSLVKAATVESYPLSDIIESTERRRQEEFGFVSLIEAGGFDYPTFFTATFDYFATGEGLTIGIVMGHAHSAARLTELVTENFGTYYASGAELWPRLQLPPNATSLVPDAIRAVIADPTQVIGNFFYASTYHLNQS